jgi:uncharacterized membrane protein YkoI
MKSYRTLAQSLVVGAAFAALPALAFAAMTPDKTVQSNFDSAKVSLEQAINTVQTQIGGKVTNAAFQSQDSKPGYVVTAYVDGTMKAMWVDPQTGIASAIAKPSTSEATVETQDKADASSLNSAKTTLAEAVSMAQQKAGGKAFDAGLQKHDQKLAISVDVLKDGAMSTYWVDPTEGKLEG